jgi:hypothetical protein
MYRIPFSPVPSTCCYEGHAQLFSHFNFSDRSFRNQSNSVSLQRFPHFAQLSLRFHSGFTTILYTPPARIYLHLDLFSGLQPTPPLRNRLYLAFFCRLFTAMPPALSDYSTEDSEVELTAPIKVRLPPRNLYLNTTSQLALTTCLPYSHRPSR